MNSAQYGKAGYGQFYYAKPEFNYIGRLAKLTISESFESAIIIYENINVIIAISEEYQAGMVVYQDAI